MKLIVAIIRPEKLDEARRALEKVGFPGLNISEVDTVGRVMAEYYTSKDALMKAVKAKTLPDSLRKEEQ